VCKKCGTKFTDLQSNKVKKTEKTQEKINGNNNFGVNKQISMTPRDDEIFESIKKDIEKMGVKENSFRPINIDETFEDIKKKLEDIENMPVKEGSGAIGSSVVVSSEKGPKTKADFSVYAVSGTRPAGFFIRLLAYSIDNLILGVISLILFAAACLMIGSLSIEGKDPTKIFYSLYVPFVVFSSVIEAFYFTYFHAVTGQTVGKWICGLRVVGEDGKNLGFKKAFLRFLGYFVSRVAIYIGFIWIAFDKRKQGWHDKIAKCIVIYSI